MRRQRTRKLGPVMRTWCTLAALASAAACATTPSAKPPPSPVTSADALLGHVRTLSSDAFAGRAPGTVGEERTVAYVRDAFARAGLAPAAEGGSFEQLVPLVGITSAPVLELDVGGHTSSPRFPDEFVALSRRLSEEVDVPASEIVFVGYGVQAPEFAWDDLKGEDVRGKVLVVLVGDPPVPDPKDPSRLDRSTFGGSAMTYYGRWTYKYEQATRLGAAAVLIVHETGPAGYPYDIVRGGARENFDLENPDGNRSRVAVEGWLARETATALFQRAGLDFEKLKESAARRDFRPVRLSATASFRVKNSLRTFGSHNVVGMLRGTDPSVGNEAIVYAAHWDHFGTTARPDGGQTVAHGAVDNASGVAEIVEIARTLRARLPRPRRSFLFLSPTAEESGLLGARYYVEHPLVPLSKTLAEINLDMMNVWGKTRAIVSIARGRSTLDDLLEKAAREQGRRVHFDPEPEKGYFYRSDNFEFAKRGVPVLSFLRPGVDYVDRPAGFAAEKQKAFIANDYHRPSDEIHADWDMSGAVDDVELLARVGELLDAAKGQPEWDTRSEFQRNPR